mmetsp:Transcript_138113/g.195485  ORF Transcript_138113/g.195485 Transcript_138113/m.195485 type:complete len:211 (+) Transcript_138113:801-1433(+)
MPRASRRGQGEVLLAPHQLLLHEAFPARRASRIATRTMQQRHGLAVTHRTERSRSPGRAVHAPRRELDELHLGLPDVELELLQEGALEVAQHIVAALMAARVRTRDVHGGILAAPAEFLLEAVEPTALAGCMATSLVHVHRRRLPAEGAKLRNLVSEAWPKAVAVDGPRKVFGLFDCEDQALRESLLAATLGAKDFQLPTFAALRKLAHH